MVGEYKFCHFAKNGKKSAVTMVVPVKVTVTMTQSLLLAIHRGSALYNAHCQGHKIVTSMERIHMRPFVHTIANICTG